MENLAGGTCLQCNSEVDDLGDFCCPDCEDLYHAEPITPSDYYLEFGFEVGDSCHFDPISEPDYSDIPF
jgi:hypothetical protein